jgi:hypothetical protein
VKKAKRKFSAWCDLSTYVLNVPCRSLDMLVGVLHRHAFGRIHNILVAMVHGAAHPKLGPAA